MTCSAQFRARHARPQPLASRLEGGKRPAQPTCLPWAWLLQTLLCSSPDPVEAPLEPSGLILGIAPSDTPTFLVSSPRCRSPCTSRSPSGTANFLVSSPPNACTKPGRFSTRGSDALCRSRDASTTLVLATRQAAPLRQPPGPGRCRAWRLSRSVGARLAGALPLNRPAPSEPARTDGPRRAAQPTSAQPIPDHLRPSRRQHSA